MVRFPNQQKLGDLTCQRLRFSSDADIVRLTNARIIIIIISIYYITPIKKISLLK